MVSNSWTQCGYSLAFLKVRYLFFDKNFNEDMFLFNQSKILKYIQFSHNLTNKEMSLFLTDNKSVKTYERLKNGHYQISLLDFASIKYHLNLNEIEVFSGFVRFDQDDPERYLPKRYRDHLGSSGEFVCLYIDYFILKTSRDTFREFCKREGVRPEYFVNRSNNVSITFLFDLLGELARKGLWCPHEFSNYACNSYLSITKNKMAIQSLRQEDLMNFILKIENNHLFKKEDETTEGTVVSFSPLDNVDRSQYKNNPIMQGSNEDLVVNNLSNMLGAKGRIIQKMHNGYDRCVAVFSK